MKQWLKEIGINAPIEQVWQLFDGSLEQMQAIIPQVIENKPVKVTPEVVGSVYRQTYKEGSRTQEYDVTTYEYENRPERKRMRIGFTLAKLFEIQAVYELRQTGDRQTHLTYSGSTRPLNWLAKLFMLFAKDKAAADFVARVKQVAENGQRL